MVVGGVGPVGSTRSVHPSQGSPQLASTAARSWPSTEPSRLVSAGQVVEQGPPAQLLAQPAGEFVAIVEALGEAQATTLRQAAAEAATLKAAL